MRRTLPLLALLSSTACLDAGTSVPWPDGDWAALFVVVASADGVGVPRAFRVEPDRALDPIAIESGTEALIVAASAELLRDVNETIDETRLSEIALEFSGPIDCPRGRYDPRDDTELRVSVDQGARVFRVASEGKLTPLSEPSPQLRDAQLIVRRDAGLCASGYSLRRFGASTELLPSGSAFDGHVWVDSDRAFARVTEVRDGEMVGPDRALIAPDAYLLLIERERARLDDAAHLRSAPELFDAGGGVDDLSIEDIFVFEGSDPPLAQVLIANETTSTVRVVEIAADGLAPLSAPAPIPGGYDFLVAYRGGTLIVPGERQGELWMTRSATSPPEAANITFPFEAAQTPIWTRPDEELLVATNSRLLLVPIDDVSKRQVITPVELQAAESDITAVAYDPSEAGTIYVAGRAGGGLVGEEAVFRRRGAGSWEPVVLHLPEAAQACTPELLSSCGRFASTRQIESLAVLAPGVLAVIVDGCYGVFLQRESLDCDLGHLEHEDLPLSTGRELEGFSEREPHRGRLIYGDFGTLLELE